MSSEELKKILDEGMAKLQQDQQDFAQKWEEHLNTTIHAGAMGLAESPGLPSDGFNDEVKKLLNAFGGQPLSQLVVLAWQQNLFLNRLFIMVQAMAAHMANVEAPATSEAVESLS